MTAVSVDRCQYMQMSILYLYKLSYCLSLCKDSCDTLNDVCTSDMCCLPIWQIPERENEIYGPLYTIFCSFLSAVQEPLFQIKECVASAPGA